MEEDFDHLQGHYLKDAEEHYPQYNIVEKVKDGVPQQSDHSGENVIEVETIDGIIIGVL